VPHPCQIVGASWTPAVTDGGSWRARRARRAAQRSYRVADRLHLFVYPLTRGEGQRLFTESASPTKFDLARAEAFDNGVLYLNYRAKV
jgi:hypothetical protein